MSRQLTSAEIQDGKIEYDPVTKAKTLYKHIEGGYEVHITTPQQNGTVKTQVKTFYDPKPVTEEDLLKQQQEKKKRSKKPNQVVQIDKNTTMITREIPGGYEEVYTTVYDDGSKSMRTKTFYDAVEEEIVDESNTNTKVQQKKNKPSSKLTRHDTEEEERNVKKTSKNQLVEANQRNVRQVNEDSNEQYNTRRESIVEETRSVSKKTETSGKKTIVRKESVQEENTKSVTTSSKDKKKKSKRAPPPPADFPQNETTTVTASKVPGGNEYTYSTVLEDGKTVTTSKTIYEEEEVEMTEEEIQIYKKQLKDAEKHKNVTTTKKLKSESGTKKIVPSENPGEVTTVETIKIEGGTEYRYTTVTAEGIVKKAIKTVYDPTPKENPDDSEEEEEIIEDYEEEIIEPGEKIFKTIESVKTLPQRFDDLGH
ncbi:eukaryotic translation initiation factor 5B isoform X2 [Eupeodes corollae]|uniref:eukaryotic translation initiation factor 5B isoform X2 n=1 Tax=Eupeodes corollae TaxID=290404 RepID=UPI002493736C|nr:eukaryotic translation initiation factor 5B isoform X2 [Eupeodes corollae]